MKYIKNFFIALLITLAIFIVMVGTAYLAKVYPVEFGIGFIFVIVYIGVSSSRE